MKKLLVLMLTFGSFHLGSAQNIGINTTGNPADASAILDVSSTAGGLLIPRMTTAERGAIVAPATSLMIFNTDNSRFEYYDGAAWKAQNAGMLILLSNDEADATGVATTASVKSFAVPANIYSQIMVEVEIGLDQTGIPDSEWTFTIQYAGVSKATSNIRLKGSGAADAHKTVGVLKYSEAMTAGGTVVIDVTAVAVNGTWRVNSFRVYGII